MCGIAGVLAAAGPPAATDALVRRMTAAQLHRGPDETGFFVSPDGAVGLGFCRLAIIDLKGGQQPMVNEDGTVHVIFNGEIYNFESLRERLTGLGHTFRTRSDTEVIVHAYEQYGARCAEHLRGMFAFAVWDARRRQLVLGRDRLGKKPLFYYHRPGLFVFGSEPKAIFQDPRVTAEADLDAVHDYLTYGYVPSPQSAFRGLHKLAPAHVLTWRDDRVAVERYWQLQYRPSAAPAQELEEGILHHLREAVRMRLISEVPLGAFLSGGVDSSTIVALMSEASAAPVKTFSIGFEEDDYNELPYARMVAERYGTDHHEFIVKPDAVAILPDLVAHYNEPYADSSAVATWYLAKMTRQHVTVALNGDGGDENFGGYERYAGHLAARRGDVLPAPVRRALAWGAARLPDAGAARGLYRKGRRFVTALGDTPHERYARWIGFFTPAMKRELYAPAFAEATRGRDSLRLLREAFAGVDATDAADAVLGADVAMYLPDDLLVKVDIASMAHSLEARSPLVDHVVMEFAATIPMSYKVRGRTTKAIFKRAVRDLVPAAVLDRPKMGFGVPIDRWFRHELRDLAHDTLLGSRAVQRGLFRPEAVRRLLEEHEAGTRAWHFHLWNLLLLELWFQEVVE